MAGWGVIAAFSALLIGTSAAAADESSTRSAVNARILSSVVGVSSFYGPGFHGRPTATGEIFDRNGISAAHKTLPIPCYARVTNLANGRSIVVRVNDRGPYVAGRILDVSERVSKLLGYYPGMSRVRLDYLGKAGPANGDENRALLASLRVGETPVAVARGPSNEDGVSAIARTSALGYAEPVRSAPAAAALAAAVRPPSASASASAPVALEPLSLATRLDASAHQLQAAIEQAHQSAVRAVAAPYGQLVVDPFKRVVQALK